METHEASFSCTLPVSRVTNRLTPMELPLRVEGTWGGERWIYKTGKGNPAVFTWRRKFETGDRLTAPENAIFLQMAQRYLIICTEGLDPHSDSIAISTAFNRVSTLISVMNSLRLKGYRSFQSLPLEAIVELKQAARTGFKPASKKAKLKLGRRDERYPDVVGKDRVKEIYRVFFDIERFFVKPTDDGSYLLGDGFAFAPFNNWREAIAASEALGRDEADIDDVPHSVVFKFLDVSIQYIFDFADELLDLQDRADEVRFPTRTRRRVGESVGSIVNVLLEQLDLHPNVRRLKVPVNRQELARRAGCEAYHCKQGPGSTGVKLYETILAAEAAGKLDAGALSELGKLKERYSLTPTLWSKSRNRKAGLPYFGRTSGTCSPWPINTVYSSNKQDQSLEKALSDLWSSCFIIVTSFMADRLDEALHLDVDCLDRGIDGWYLKGLTFKARNNLSGSSTAHPCPSIVVRAVEVLKRLGQRARLSSGSEKLFLDGFMRKKIPDPATVRGRLERFGEVVLLDESEANWKLIPKHMRRFFVTAWIHYFSYGSNFNALREFLKHEELATTAMYGYRTAKGRTVRDEQSDLLMTVNNISAFDGVDLKGPGSKFLHRIYREAKIKYQTIEEQGVEIELQTRKRKIIVYPMPWGLCLWNSMNIAKARCGSPSDPGSMQDWPMNKKTHVQCWNCINFIVWAVFKPFWAGALKRHNLAASNPLAPPVVVNAGLKGVEIAKHYCEML